MTTLKIEDIAEKINTCMEIGDQVQGEEKTNPFVLYLKHMKETKRMGYANLADYYKANKNIKPNTLELFQGENALPGDLDIISLGGGYNSVYRVSLTQGDQTLTMVLKLDNQNKREYLDADEILLNDKDLQKTILGGDYLYLGEASGERHMLCPYNQGGDASTEMKKVHRKGSKDDIYQFTVDIMTQVVSHQGVLSDHDIFLSDMKPGNIFIDEHGNVRFSDLKGMMKGDTASSIGKLDRTPGYTPKELYDSKGPVDIKALNIHHLLVTMECIVKGKEVEDRLDEDLEIKGGEIFFTPDFSDIDISLPSGQMLQVITTHLESLKSGRDINYHKIFLLMNNLTIIANEQPGLMEHIYVEMEKNPIGHRLMLDFVTQGVTSPEGMIKKAAKSKSKYKSFLPKRLQRRRKKYEVYKSLKQSLKEHDFEIKEKEEPSASQLNDPEESASWQSGTTPRESSQSDSLIGSSRSDSEMSEEDRPAMERQGQVKERIKTTKSPNVNSLIQKFEKMGSEATEERASKKTQTSANDDKSSSLKKN